METKKNIPPDADGKILKYLYSNFLTRNILSAVLRKNVLRIVQKYTDSRISTIHINRFAKKRSITIDEKYSSFNEFFARGGNNAVFPKSSAVLGSPCEGNLTILQNIGNGETAIELKGETFTPASLLKGSGDRFNGGTAYVFRLTTAHCHRLYSFDNCTIRSEKSIKGGYHSTHAVVQNTWKNTLCTNYRIVQIMDTENFGCVAVVQIGSMLVSSITRHVELNRPIKKGDALSSFKLGGSAVVLLFEPNVAVPCEQLIKDINYVSIGDKIGDKTDMPANNF